MINVNWDTHLLWVSQFAYAEKYKWDYKYEKIMHGWVILITCGVVVKLYQIVVCSNTICVLVSVLSIVLMLRQKTSVQQQITLFSFVLMGIISFGYWFLLQ